MPDKISLNLNLAPFIVSWFALSVSLYGIAKQPDYDILFILIFTFICVQNIYFFNESVGVRSLLYYDLVFILNLGFVFVSGILFIWKELALYLFASIISIIILIFLLYYTIVDEKYRTKNLFK
jgi:hypothetical protein